MHDQDPFENTKIRIEKIVIAQNLSNQLSVLDIGCADLRNYSIFLYGYFKNYTGVEFSNEFVKKVNNNPETKNINVIQGNVEKLNFQEESYDIIVCNNMLAMTNTALAFKEIFRVLKKGGYLISLNNNTIEYSKYKMFRYKKMKEFFHSIMVIVNTFVFRNFKIKIHHTTYFTKEYLLKDLNPYNHITTILHLDVSKNSLPYNTINFIARKNE